MLNIGSKIPKIASVQKSIENFMHTNVIMQWDNISKTILILAMGGLDFLVWILWLVYSYHSPELNHWIDSTHYPFFLSFYILAAVLYFILIFICYCYKRNKLFQKYMPYIAVGYFGITMLFAGFAIGTSNPATIAGYITVVTVGLVLYERKIIYSTFIPGTIILLLLITLCAKDLIIYAPIFSEELDAGNLYQNSFWVYSMLFLYTPIFIVSIVLFEVLLIQWRNRELLINEISRRDPLTGILNRRSIGEFLKKLEDRHQMYAVILLDLDYFKKINDTYGHDVGDQVLITVSNILSNIAIDGECLGRYGGEEFILILPALNKDQAINIANRCREAIAETLIRNEDGTEFNISASFGVAISDATSKKEDVIRMADQALYIAKDKGRNQVQFLS